MLVAQLVEHRTFNPGVEGSNPFKHTINLVERGDLMLYVFIDSNTHKSLGKLHLSVGLKKGHRLTGFGHTYSVDTVVVNDLKSAVVYLKQI